MAYLGLLANMGFISSCNLSVWFVLILVTNMYAVISMREYVIGVGLKFKRLTD